MSNIGKSLPHSVVETRFVIFTTRLDPSPAFFSFDKVRCPIIASQQRKISGSQDGLKIPPRERRK